MKRSLLIGIAVLSIGVIAFFILQDRTSTSKLPDHGLLFPELVDQVNNVTTISVRTNQFELSVIFENEAWRVKELEFYPAIFSLVQNFLIGMSQLRKLEAKTGNPDKHAALDLAGIEVMESPTIKITLLSAESEILADLYIGKQKFSKRNSHLYEYYVREPNQDQTWLSESSQLAMSKPFDWLDSDIVDLDEIRVGEVQIMSGNAPPIRVYKLSGADKNYLLASLPDQHKIRYQYSINDIGEVFRNLRFEDVKKATGWVTRATVATKTFDGLEVTAKLGSGEFKDYAVFSADVDEAATTETQEESVNLNRRWEGWAYKMSDIRLATIETKFDDLVEPITDT